MFLLLEKISCYFITKNIFIKNTNPHVVKNELKDIILQEFKYVDMLYDAEFSKYKSILEILSKYLYNDIIFHMKKYILFNIVDSLLKQTNDTMIKLTWNLILFFEGHDNNILLDENLENFLHFLKCNYFEYRMITFNETKICDTISYQMLL